MNFSNSKTVNTEKLKDIATLSEQWESIDWDKAEKQINRLQIRIAKAAVTGNNNKIKRFQYLLTHSFYAKALAVKKVTSNRGKNTSGIDKKLWSTSAAKMKATLSLTDKHYRAKPLRRVYIEKKDKKKSDLLEFPQCMIERCKPFTHSR
jgi:RNA-directed DNA polymerase